MGNNKGFNLALVIAVGILLGVMVVSKQKDGAMHSQILGMQSQMLTKLARLEGGSQGSSGNLSQQVAQLSTRIKSLEARIKTLESRPAAPTQQARQAPPQPDPNTVYTIPVAHSVIGGAQNPKVTIVEFVDYECPFCARFHDPMVEAAKAYPNDVGYIIKHFPLSFHPKARPAAKAALAAGEQWKFIEMSELILDNQKSLSQEAYEKFASDLGLNLDKFKSDLQNNSARYEQIINDDMALGRKVNVRGTPSFYINGKVANARDVGSWKAAIDSLFK